MRNRTLPLATLLVLLVAACGSSPASFSDAGADGGPDSTSRTADSGHHVTTLGGETGSASIVALSISPSTSTLTVTDLAAPPTTKLVASATYSNGTHGTVAATWSVDRLDIASIGAATGVLTPTGTSFGTVKVTAMSGGQSAKGTVTVAAKLSLNPGMLTASEQSALSLATAADPGVTAFAYPYDGTVFPLGLLPPQQMWNGGASGDDYSLHYVVANFDLTVFTKADPPSQFTLPVATWNTLSATAQGSDVAITLNHLAGATAYTSAHQTWHVSTANLGGSIYYWAINEGQILKIDLATGTRTNVFQSGPNTALGTPAPFDDGALASPPWESNGSTTSANTRCVACHSVSKDGSTLSSVVSRAGSAGPLGFVNLATSSLTAVGDYQMDTAFDALTPDGSLAVMNQWGMTMQLLTSATGMPVASALDSLTGVSHPAFSPDGTKLALATNCGPAGSATSIEFHQSDLTFYAFANAAPFFTSPVTVATSTGLGDAFAFPSFSPDSSFIFFQRGAGSRAKITDPTTGDPTHDADDLYVAAAAAGATPIALANANNPGGILPTDSQHLNYAPTVNPIAAGGYIWVVFTSPRDYGNAMVSPAGPPPMDASYANRKQLWVTAVDANIGAADPSHPPFWLPGQDLTSINMFGYWALSPCLPTVSDSGTSSCSAGFDCCSGFCEAGDAGSVCVANVGTSCVPVGDKCSTSSDCCSGADIACVGGFCQETTPK